ncbi:hypothetical protein [Coralliovum pocilloporae]|uniref:hypothetical protein n=1 Tax=Coralliovum pocilloporae TaxID=3066369 RepID=UPI003306C23A
MTERCSMIAHGEAHSTFIITHADGTHSVVRYLDGAEVGRQSLGPDHSHENVVDQFRSDSEPVVDGICPQATC